MSPIDWTDVNAKLPTGKGDEDKAARKKMFQEFDSNKNGLLSLAEIDKGIRDVLKIDAIFDAKQAIMRAFQIAKQSKPSKRGKIGDDYVELREFRYFLLSLRQYLEYWEAFRRTDENQDQKIELAEFIANQSKVETWVGEIDANFEYKRLDGNKRGYVTFDEFCQWAINKNLDLEDDDDNIRQ